MAHLIRSELIEGTWRGELAGQSSEPRIEVTLHDRVLSGIAVDRTDDGNWLIVFPVPPEALTDGTHQVLISFEGGDLIATIPVVAGSAVPLDLVKEVDLLRAELDMLKKAFRNHVLETMG